MSRNFGLTFERLTAPPASGAQPLTGPHTAQSPRDPNIVSFPGALPPDVPVNLGGGAAPFIDEREFGALVLVGAFLSLIGFTFFAVTFFAFALFDFG